MIVLTEGWRDTTTHTGMRMIGKIERVGESGEERERVGDSGEGRERVGDTERVRERESGG